MTSPGEKYDLLLTGKTLPGRSRADVAIALSKVMRIPETQALELLSDNEQVVKRDLDEAALDNYVAVLRRAGAETQAELAANSDPRVLLLRQDVEARFGKKYVAVTPIMPWCPCCGGDTLQQRSAGERCTQCGWQDFSGQNEFFIDVAVPGRNNGLSLRQARGGYEHRYRLKHYKANVVPLRKRIVESLSALFILAYCGYSLWLDRFFLPNFSLVFLGSESRVKSITLHGIDAWLMSAAMLFAALYGLLSVIDHYDRRPNEHWYRKMELNCIVFCGLFFVLALAGHGTRESGGDPYLFAAVLVVGAGIAVAAVWGLKE